MTVAPEGFVTIPAWYRVTTGVSEKPPTVAEAAAETVAQYRPHRPALRIPAETVHTTVADDSLQPMAQRGQSILLDCSDREPADGELVLVVTQDEEVFYGRMFAQGESVQLLSVNPTGSHKPLTLKRDEIEEMHVIIGVWVG